MIDTEDIKRQLASPRKRWNTVTEMLSTGSTLLNLAISGDYRGGIPAGKYVYFVGDSSSGKTFLALTCFAEAQISEHFRNYRLIFDNAEDGALMDIRRYFGKTVADKLEPPAKDEDGDPVYSSTIEEFYFNVDDAITKSKKTGVPFVYVLDSMDALSSDYEGKKFEEKKKEVRGGAKAKGDYGDGKAKINSRYIRKTIAGIRDTNSILIVISQTRDNIDAGMFEPQQTRSGGRSLKFYATFEIWTSVGGKLKKTVNSKDRQIGIISKVSVKKNRVSGKEWTVSVPLYWSNGIDDVGGCVDFLVDEKQWKKDSNGKIDGSGDLKGCVGSREKIVQFIEEGDLEDDVRELVTDVWSTIEKSCTVERKKRYV